MISPLVDKERRVFQCLLSYYAVTLSDTVTLRIFVTNLFHYFSRSLRLASISGLHCDGIYIYITVKLVLLFCRFQYFEFI